MVVQITNQWTRFGELSEKMQGNTASAAEMQELAQLRGMLMGEAKKHDKSLKEAGIKVGRSGDAEVMYKAMNRLGYQLLGAREYIRRQVLKEVARYNKLAYANNLPRVTIDDDADYDEVYTTVMKLYASAQNGELRGEWSQTIASAIADGDARAQQNWNLHLTFTTDED